VQVRGGAGTSPATARLLDDALLLEHGLGVTVIELATLDGVTTEGATVAFHPHAQEALVLETGEAVALAQAVVDAATGVPELAASLRAMGSPRARPGSDHDAWFGPLLVARRAAHEAATPAARLAAFDAAALRTAMLACIDGFAAARAPGSAPDARALAEEFRERTAPCVVALERLASVRGAVEAASEVSRLARWHEWVAALRAVFSAADGGWEAMLPALADPRGRTGSFWRRVLRRGSAT
jgi:hypothetical protein